VKNKEGLWLYSHNYKYVRNFSIMIILIIVDAMTITSQRKVRKAGSGSTAFSSVGQRR